MVKAKLHAMNPFARALCGLCLWLGLSFAAQAASCPAGQFPVCMGMCVCVPDPRQVQEDMSHTAAPALADWLLRSRDAALAEGVQPMPPVIRQQLLAYYPSQLLDAARYKVGSNDQRGAATAMLQNPDIRAVTLVDIIVFRTQQAALNDVALWAHELKHVEQYQQWGVQAFALRYTRDFGAVEAPAYDVQIKVSQSLRRRQ